MATFQPTHPTGSCTFENAAGDPYEEFTCLYPLLGSTYTSFETSYNVVPVRDWMRDHSSVPVLACLLYGLFVVYGPRYFADKAAWNWRRGMICWNLALSVFSGIGFFRSVAPLLHNMYHLNVRQNLCNDPASSYASGSTGLW
eukprot:CAMPEP_0118706526 /NCGR_PEP_ID=MMETSP0800-20121206/20611_1 /TAXON_ID=210618 ORGANISM="Striatella unipunctata, Strain CCMP2910" /NCGR_SAMPLE_ID=MMETSP0800 /ASSEMBLY_ACC=CAM_ASM_000638 /LENGTH=141 /DNA_ID=CAMNT_0006609079 /DNA_START=76 /DNA_END=498 /DNA_ORIENTATION=+